MRSSPSRAWLLIKVACGSTCSGPSAGSMIGRAAAILVVIVIAAAIILGALVYVADQVIETAMSSWGIGAF